MTTWKQFVDEIEAEARQEGQETLDELEAFKQFWGRQSILRDSYEDTRGCAEEQPCLLDAYFKHQQTLPPSRRSAGAMISCPCRKCNPARL